MGSKRKRLDRGVELVQKHRAGVNALLGQALWFMCVIGGVRGIPLTVLTVVALLALAQVALLASARARLLLHVAIVAVVGVMVDSVLTAVGVMSAVRTIIPEPFAPVWLNSTLPSKCPNSLTRARSCLSIDCVFSSPAISGCL